MTITIGLISSLLIKDHFKKIEHELSHFCHIIYLDGSNHDRIISNYKAYEGKVDAFIFSGRAMYYYLLEHIDSPLKPCYYFNESSVDMKGIFFDLLLENRNYDFSKIYVDCAIEHNNYLGIKDILGPEELPYFTDIPYKNYSTLKAEDLLLKHHKELHESGQIKLSITRLGNKIDFFKENKIPYIYAYPTLDYMTNFTLRIIHRISQSKNDDRILASIMVTPKNTNVEARSEAAIAGSAHIRRLLREYAQLKGYDFTLQETGTYVEALTFLKDLDNITDLYTSDTLLTYLEKKSGYKLTLGFGTGNSAYQARTNANESLKISRQKDDGSYCLTYDGKLIGPFNEASQTFDLQPTPQLIRMSKDLHVNPLNLQKIISYTHMRNSKVITSDGLAEYLKISLRSANRILTKIEENKGATIYYENIDNKPGRPKKFYDMTFISKLESPK